MRLAELYYAGSHGMDIKGPARGRKTTKSKVETFLCKDLFDYYGYLNLSCVVQAKSVLFQPAREFLPMIDEVGIFSLAM